MTLYYSFRLVGCPPFWHRKQMIMLRNIMEGKYSFSSPEWADISESPKDLIRKLLVVDPNQRISIDEALRHPFFTTVVSRAFACLKRIELLLYFFYLNLNMNKNVFDIEWSRF